MGDIRKYICKCGYEKELFAGGGLGGCNVSHIANFFPEEIGTFQKERDEGKVTQYIMENEVSYCEQCHEIYALPVFTYKKKDGHVCYFTSTCPVCGNSVSKVEDEEDVACPKCGQRMGYMVLGDWD